MDNKEQKEHFIKMAELVDKAGTEYCQYLTDPSTTDHLVKIETLERDGDTIEGVLNGYYTTQRNIPYLSLDRAKLLRQLDEVLDQILLASKTLDAFGSALPSSFADEAAELARHVDNLTTLLKDAIVIMYDNFQEATDITTKIEVERDLSTELVFNLEKSFFNSEEGTTSWREFTAISRISRRTIAIINATKAASEIIEIMSLKYL